MIRQNIIFFCIEIGSRKHYLSPFLPFDLQHKISQSYHEIWRTKCFFSCIKMNHIPSLLALQKNKKTAKTLKNKIFFLKTYPPHLSLQKTKKQQNLWRKKSFSSKVILCISLLALPAFSDLPLAASQPSSLKGPASNVVISKWRNLKFDNSRQRCHLSTFRSLHKYWKVSKGRVQITRHLEKTYLFYQNAPLS